MDVSTVLKRAAEKCGATRVRYRERDVPTSVEGVTVLPFFGDRRSSFVLSSLLLKRVKEELKGSRYFVLLSWPGDEGLYPYVDEYWQPDDEAAVQKAAAEASGFSNSSSVAPTLHRSLNQYFYDVMSESDLLPYYDDGLTASFFERFRHVKVFLPSVPSVSSLGGELSRTLSRRENKVLVSPYRSVCTWRNGGREWVSVPREFWVSLLDRLVSEGFSPVVHSDVFSYDMSADVPASCLHVGRTDVLKTMSLMRACGLVLDVFQGTSRMAIAARCPFLCFDERQRFNSVKEYEVNDLCGGGVAREYIFSFAALIEKGGPALWRTNVLDHMVVKLKSMHEREDRDSWPAPVETNDIVPYDSVRKRKLKRMGSRFIRIERD